MDSLSMGRMVGNMSQREYPWVKEDKELMESDPNPQTFKDSIWAKNDKPIREEPALAVEILSSSEVKIILSKISDLITASIV